MKKRQLRNYLIEPELQLKLISYFGLVFVLTTATLYSTVFLFFWKLKQKALSVGIPQGHVFFQFIGNEKSDLDFAFLLLAVLNLVILIGVGFIVSHRVAGPIHKLKKYLASLSGKDAPEFRLREDDFIQDMVPIVNELKDRMK